MTPFITIAYLTNRLNPHIEWFFNTLNRELQGDYSNTKIVVVDLHANTPGRKESFASKCKSPICHVTPKPTPWQGVHRLTSADYFAAANARNTALCLAPDGYIVFVDDLSALLNGWWQAVKQHATNNQVVAGAYRKVRKIEVDSQGNLTHWIPAYNEKGIDIGKDSRWIEGRTGPVPCTGQSMFGCSFGIPVETMLSVNGQDECLDGLSFEDVCFGLRLDRKSVPIVYDQRMLTFEDEDLHHNRDDVRLTRINRSIDGFQDCAWEMLDWIGRCDGTARGTPDMRRARSAVLQGESFPNHSGFFVWPDGKNLHGV